MSKKNDKRQRLIEAAGELIYQQTFNSTTLADIALKADVPLGNVYYYFKTKDDILRAVVQKKESELNVLFSTWDQMPNIKDRLRSFISQSLNESETIARFGCALGSMCQELGKIGGELGTLTSDLMRKSVSWVEAQFKAMGKGDKSATLAEYLVGSIQGSSLVTLTFKDPNLLHTQTKNLELWLESV